MKFIYLFLALYPLSSEELTIEYPFQMRLENYSDIEEPFYVHCVVDNGVHCSDGKIIEARWR